jgi:hypothetical protein
MGDGAADEEYWRDGASIGGWMNDEEAGHDPLNPRYASSVLEISCALLAVPYAPEDILEGM